LRDGETITVKDMLYAMMLPSGNDAAAALAEYYGKKNQVLYYIYSNNSHIK